MSSIISFLEEILFRKSSKQTNTVIQSANEMFNQGKYSDAEKELQKLAGKKLGKEDELKYLYLESRIYMVTGRFEDVLRLSDELFELAKNQDKILTTDILITAAEANFRLARLDPSTEYLNRAADYLSLVQEQELPVNERKERKRSLANLEGAIFSKQGKLTEALEAYKIGLELAEDVNNKRGVAIAHNNIGTVMQNKGELDLALEHYSKSLKIKQENAMTLSSAITLANIGETFQEKGNTAKAKEKFLQSLQLYENAGLATYIADMLYSLVRITAETSIEEAEEYLTRIRELDSRAGTPVTHQQVKLSEAVILKNSSRSVKKAKAQELFEQVSNEPVVNFELTTLARLNLCELLLEEYKERHDDEVMKEISTHVSDLIELSKNQKSSSLLARSYFIKSQLALLSLDIEQSKQLLTQAQMLAEESGLEKLAMEISDHHDRFLNEIDKWESLIKRNASLEERMDLVDLENVLIRMIRKESYEVSEITEVPVLLMIMSEVGFTLYSKKFAEGLKLDDQLISGFLTAINSFSKEAFAASGIIERIKHKEFTLIMKPRDRVLFCYVFKDHSYSAGKKLEQLIMLIQQEEVLWNNLNSTGIISKQQEEEEIIEKHVTRVFG